MSFNATLVAGWTYITGDTVTATNLNALGLPTVTIPDNQTYLIAVGSVGTPGIAFNGDVNTGVAQIGGADTVSLVAGGSEMVRVTTQGALFAVGSVSAPSIFFSGDTNTGFYQIGADSFGVTCGGGLVGTWSTTGLNATGLSVNGLAVRTTGVSIAQTSFSTDFIGSTTSWGTTSTVVATGAVSAVAAGHGTIDTGGRGMIDQNVSAVADRSVVTCGFGSTVGAVYRARLQINGTLSTPSERYFVIAGMFNDLTVTTAAGNGAWFQYIDSASAQWQTVTYNGTTRETQTTAVTVATGTWVTLEIRHTAASTWTFYINGTLVTTHTAVTFATTTGNFQYVGIAVEKTVGTGARGIYSDSIEVQTDLTRT